MEADQRFVTKFTSYLQWVADGEKRVEEDRRADMLEAFQYFLIAHDIRPNREIHFKLLAKMTEFAKGADKGGPRT